MRAIELDGTVGWTAEKDAFVAAESSVRFDIKFAGLTTGRRGGEGFVLERFTGAGTLLIAGAGNFIDLNPSDYGGKIQVDTGCVVAFDDNITYGVERIGKLDAQGMKTAFFGGESFSLATLEGSGTVILQSVSMVALARTLVGAAGQASTEGTAGSIRGILGGGTD
ncbi:MAG TPA: AIM24 family protein, partial [Actinomycetota bacterium]|nr:AIM24 family protein [Actinomycetota bacterium]